MNELPGKSLTTVIDLDMNKPSTLRRTAKGFLALLLALQTASVACAATNEFFPFCIDTHDARKRDLPQQAAMLKDLGYAGMGHLWLDNLSERLQTLDAAGLKLYQITLQVNIAPGKTPYDARLKSALPLLQGRNVQLVLIMSGLKPADPEGDARAVEILREMSDLAKPSGTELLVYPHTGDWVQSVDDAFRIAQKVDRPNVNVMFNLCHWLRVSKDRDYATLLKTALPRLHAISINGADAQDPNQGWGRYIQPLGRGDFDVLALLKTLKGLGYTGPVGLQCYGIEGDTAVHLKESMAAWRQYTTQLSGK
jgi:sugar phosphate isomerase/epimerase